MSTVLAGRAWLIGGAIVAIVMAVAAWFGALSPQYAQADSVRADAAAAEQRAGALRTRINQLREENDELAARRAELRADRQALPTDSGMPALLRQLQSLGDQTSVAVSGLTVGVASEVTAANTKAYRLPLAVTATGTAANLQRFLDQLQRVQPRAILVSTANLVLTGTSGTAVLTVTCHVFVAPTGAAQSANAQPSASPSSGIQSSAAQSGQASSPVVPSPAAT